MILHVKNDIHSRIMAKMKCKWYILKFGIVENEKLAY